MVRFAAALIAVAAALVSFPADAQQILLLDFWSPQCGPCMHMKPIVHSFEQAGYPIQTIDTTRDVQRTQQYNVTQIPCFIMLVNGRETERQVGAMSSENLQQMFERAKDQLRLQAGTHPQSPDTMPPSMQSAVRPQGMAPGLSAAGPAPQFNNQSAPPKGTSTFGPSVSETKATNTAPISPANAPLLDATVRLSVDDAGGRSYGTGTIIDTRQGEALVITCGHLFRESQGKTPVKADLFEVEGNTLHEAGHATGQVISYDLQRDVALVSIRPDHAVHVATVAPPKSPIDRSDRVIGIGCSNGQDPTVLESRVTAIDRYQGPSNIEASGAPTIGRSGGGLFNSKGELIGICNNADNEGNEGIYAGLDSIHEELDRAGLKEIYLKAASGTLASQSNSGTGTSGDSPLIRLQAPSEPTSTKSAVPHNLNDTEQAALQEIMSRASNSEVVCIVRPKDTNSQSEVITLDNVSPEFVAALKQQSAATSKLK